MDREEIERQDFPAARRGYDPSAVDAHLRRVADEFDAVARGGPASLADGASSRVHAILEAAETSARELRRDAGREASGHVERVEDAAKGMLDKLDRLHGELDRLLLRLRSTAETLTGSLEALSRDVGTLGTAAAPAPSPASSPHGSAREVRASEPALDAPASEPALGAPASEPAPSAPAPEPAPSAPPSDGARSDDEAGARLVALNMALEGAGREETARFLAEHYALSDLGALLDDVYASAGR